MFGYVRVEPSELLVREYEYYKSVYCGLCRAIGKTSGQASRLALTYDGVFLALVRMALSGEKCTTENFRCGLKLFKKRSRISGSEALNYAARASAVLLYGKIEDDLHDEKSFKKLRARLTYLPAKRACNKASLNSLSFEIKCATELLRDIEKRSKQSFDLPAEINADLCAKVFSEGITDEGKKKLASDIGFYTGRLVYTIDAIDDLDSDIKSSAYNPIYALYGNDAKQMVGELLGGIENDIALLTERIVELKQASCPTVYALIYNIVTLGIPAAAKKALNKYGKT